MSTKITVALLSVVGLLILMGAIVIIGSQREAPVEAQLTRLGPPAAPSNLTATASSSALVKLSWKDNSNNEDGFAIERKTGTSTVFVEIARVGRNITTYNDNTVQRKTTYTYRVRAFNRLGNSPYSNEATVTTPDSIPNPPSNLTATATSSTQVVLNWRDNSDNETGFKIERSLNGTSFVNIATTTANVTVYSDFQVLPGTTYYYRLKAFNSGGDSTYSNVASVTTLEDIPNSPSNLTATTTAGVLETGLTWRDNSDNEDGFKVERATNATTTFDQIAVVGVNRTSYVDRMVAADTTYYYRVKAFNGKGDSAPSNMDGASFPNAPSNLTATATSSTLVILNWRDNSLIEELFKIERGIGTTTFLQIATTSANVTRYDDTTVVGKTLYFYRLRAGARFDDSAYSNTASTTTP